MGERGLPGLKVSEENICLIYLICVYKAVGLISFFLTTAPVWQNTENKSAAFTPNTQQLAILPYIVCYLGWVKMYPYTHAYKSSFRP